MARAAVSRIREGQNRCKLCAGTWSIFAAQPWRAAARFMRHLALNMKVRGRYAAADAYRYP